MFQNLTELPGRQHPAERVLCNAVPEKLNKLRVLGVLAGGDLSPERLGAWVRSAHTILAADGAANDLHAINVVPDATIGDFDSISMSTKDVQLELFHIEDQDSSDCDKLLGVAADKGFSEITLIGVEGDLLDHVLGNLFSAAKSKLKVRFSLRRGIGYVLKGPVRMGLDVPVDTRMSLMPISDCSGVSIEGAHWPLNEAALSPLGLTSLSNRAEGPIRLSIRSGAAILFLAHPDLEQPSWEEWGESTRR